MNTTEALIVLIHSPLVGPSTWKLVAEELGGRGMDVLLPTLHDEDSSQVPYWQQHAQSVVEALDHIAHNQPVVLIGHSGAGPLLPAVAEYIPQPVAAYIYVDAGIPCDGASRLDLLAEELPQIAPQIRAALEKGQRFPSWTDSDLAGILPDNEQRQRVLAEMNPRGLRFYTESLPVFAGWPDAPCAYLQFSPAYDYSTQQARDEKFYVHVLKGGHFHMLVEPAAVAETLLDILTQITD
jgi:pimeloyl-ACP methyl ester carboxylesterase